MAVTRDTRSGEQLMGAKQLQELSIERTRWFEKQLGVEPFDKRWGPKLQELLA
jgi:hypothetical protein